jgi:hypothetical protein
MMTCPRFPQLGVCALAFLTLVGSGASSASPRRDAVAQAAPPTVAGQAGPPTASQAGAPGVQSPRFNDVNEAAAKAARTIAPYFRPATAGAKAPDAEGFLRRWLLLEPISKPNRTNTVFVDSYLRETFAVEYFPNQLTVVPRHGDAVTVAGERLAWHALDSANWNVKLFRFAYGLNKPVYGVIFWAVTVVDSPRELTNVRLAVGSNAASMWWVNGEEALLLSGDRRMVADDAVSKRLTLKKGTNIVRGVVINGPGMSDFCVRFVDDAGRPVKTLTQILDGAGR